MWCSLDRELQIPQEGKSLALKEEPLEVVEQSQIEDMRVETSTQVETSREGRKRIREADRLLQDARENVVAPSNLCKQRRSPNWYTYYMAIMTKLVETEPSYFEEVVEKPVWVDAMVEEYKSIENNRVWNVVPRLKIKSILG